MFASFRQCLGLRTWAPLGRAVGVAAMLGFCFQASGWNGTGHMVVALVAYEQLSVSERAAVVEVLQSHFRYQEDFLDRMPDDVRGADAATRDKWVFAHAATWPDIARGFRGALKDTYHHSTWHYINEPYFLNDEAKEYFGDCPPANTHTAWRPYMRDFSLNIIQALSKSEAALADTQMSKADKALNLCWLFHLVGDLHQPLHSTALFSVALFPEGDRGGNLIPVGSSTKLHSFWDSRLGRTERLATLSSRVSSYLKDAQLSSLGVTALRQLDSATWLAESVEAARTDVYTSLILDAVSAREAQVKIDIPEDEDAEMGIIPLSDAYKTNAKEVSTQRVVQAGYRLAGVLKTYNF